MTDAVFLRTNISSMIYADQMNTAHISGSQAARERAMRVQQEALKEAESQIKKVEELDKLDIKEEEERRRKEEQAFNEQEEQAAEEEPSQEASQPISLAPYDETKAIAKTPKPRQVKHIDLTI